MKMICSLIPLYLCLIAAAIAQTALPDCSNLYNATNLPTDWCSQIDATCNFGPFANSSLILVNASSSQGYLLCLDLPTFDITVSTGIDVLDGSLLVMGNSITMGPNYRLLNGGSTVIIANQSISVVNSNLTGGLLWLQAPDITITNATFLNDQYFATNCNCLEKGVTCSLTQYYFPYLYGSLQTSLPFSMQLLNYTYSEWNFMKGANSIVLAANNSLSLNYTNIRYSVAALYSAQLSMNYSVVNTSGLGYPSGMGNGCGYFDEVLNQLLGCTGTGGSYGGFGGNSGPDNCNLLMSNPPYGRQALPKYPGSGGGFFLKEITEISSGGGVVNIQVGSALLVNSNISSNGYGGVQGGGGGSGGTVSLDFSSLVLTGKNNISANGGNGKSSGGGGRIRIWNHNWRTVQPTVSGLFQIKSAGGLDCEAGLSCGEIGSVISSPCPPGYTPNQSTFICTACQTGQYQLGYGYSKCTKCNNAPTYGSNTPPNETAVYSSFASVCPFNCTEKNLYLYDNKLCLTNLEYALFNVGGIDFVISIGIIVAALVIFLVVVMIRKLSYSDKNIFDDSEHVDYFRKKSYFKIEDIPYHDSRIYFAGDNTPAHPWHLPAEIEPALLNRYNYDPKIPTLFSRMIRELNDICTYGKALSSLLWVLKVFYYPLGLFVAAAFRERKANQVREAIVNRLKNVDTHIAVKLHVNSQYSVGCVQIFNMRRQTLDFYIRNYFPLCFQLHPLLLGGYAIDFSDPLLKALISEFDDHADKPFEQDLIHLNQLLRNCGQPIPIFKHLWKIFENQPLLQCFLWQPDIGTLGIQGKFTINPKKQLFLLFSTESREQMLGGNEEGHIWVGAGQGDWWRGGQFFDEISCIRHKYNLRQAQVEAEQRKTVFWEIENTFRQKYLSWSLGSVSIITLLLNMLSFFLIIFLLVEDSGQSFLFGFIPYFALFPLCEFMAAYLQFNLIVSKGAKVLGYAIYFVLFCIGKFLVLIVIILTIAIENGFDDNVLVLLFYVWLVVFAMKIAAIILLCMLHVHYAKVK